MLCVFSVMVSTLGAALVNEIFGLSRDVVSSGLSMSSSAPRKEVKMSLARDSLHICVHYQTMPLNVDSESRFPDASP